MSSELKPCPFCGGKAIVGEYDFRGAKHFDVWCGDDGRCARLRGAWPTKEAAIAAWNRRAGEETK